jgi:hypothetical protein
LTSQDWLPRSGQLFVPTLVAALLAIFGIASLTDGGLVVGIAAIMSSLSLIAMLTLYVRRPASDRDSD